MSSSASASSTSTSSNGAAGDFSSRQATESMVMEYEVEEVASLETDKAVVELPVDSEDEYTYSGEPLADEEWLAQYKREIEEELEQKSMLKQRLEGTLSVGSWCLCGNCNTELLENINECYCCMELDKCIEALESDRVQKDVGGRSLSCIVDHPGFSPVCLEKWSLLMAADRLHKKNKTRYQQTGSEEGFLRSISYRVFTKLVYGFLGYGKRIPLPACAYNKIRRKFRAEEEFTGFELED